MSRQHLIPPAPFSACAAGACRKRPALEKGEFNYNGSTTKPSPFAGRVGSHRRTGVRCGWAASDPMPNRCHDSTPEKQAVTQYYRYVYALAWAASCFASKRLMSAIQLLVMTSLAATRSLTTPHLTRNSRYAA